MLPRRPPIIVLALNVAVTAALVLPLSPTRAADKINPPPKVPLAFNRLYNYPELEAALRQLERAHTGLLRLTSLGKSVEGRDLWCMVINNPATGGDRSKAAMYVDGNIHGNEVQAGEACLYLIWYLTENYDRVAKIKEIVDERAFYVIPTVNPDGRAHWFDAPNSEHSSRSGKAPRDDDRDGLTDEDGADDLDGDGHITTMRRKVKGGRYKVSPEDPRLLVLARPDEEGAYDVLGEEGIDNDGDGQVNEDSQGGYDMNRNWPADWQPEHLQAGAGNFPLCWPETRSIARFILDHPNIAGVQAFHNAAGMILRGPGDSSRQVQYPLADDRVAEQIGAMGAKQIPGYRNVVQYKDLYSIHGGFIGWTYEHLGIFSFNNELWNIQQLFGIPAPDAAARAAAASTNTGSRPSFGPPSDTESLFASDRLFFGADAVPWKPYKHPLYGDIEIGGTVKHLGWRVPPPFMLEELCHRNAAFVVYHADQMPRIVLDELKAEKLADGVYTVTVTLQNTRSIPTRSQQAVRHQVGLPDTLSLTGDDLTVAVGGTLVDRYTGEIAAAERDPQSLRLESGVASHATARYRWVVRGKDKRQAQVKYESQKGGTLTKSVTLE
jgi:Zinc carboxypeptidase